MTFGKLTKAEAQYRPCQVHDRDGAFDRCCKDCVAIYRQTVLGTPSYYGCRKVVGIIHATDTCNVFEPR